MTMTGQPDIAGSSPPSSSPSSFSPFSSALSSQGKPRLQIAPMMEITYKDDEIAKLPLLFQQKQKQKEKHHDHHHSRSDLPLCVGRSCWIASSTSQAAVGRKCGKRVRHMAGIFA
mmetsp:Transcript_33397/g.72220  ORF Transcript_33397/g.72220 Transcript_33397/m.72220 type:complete len:115 (+) Transcript_33397:895-1239(+)